MSELRTVEYIPDKPIAKITELAKRIAPVVRHEGQLFYIDPHGDIFTTSYLWNVTRTHEATNLRLLSRIITYHSWGYYGFFKPSIAEVLAQIPDSLVPKTDAFEIEWYPQDADDLNQQQRVVNDGYHMAVTCLFGLNVDAPETR